MTHRLNRREFLGRSAVAVTTLAVGYHTSSLAAESKSPAEKLRIASVGCQGRAAAKPVERDAKSHHRGDVWPFFGKQEPRLRQLPRGRGVVGRRLERGLPQQRQRPWAESYQ